MREIKLSGTKVYKQTIQLVEAIAWATNRRGRHAWKSDVNVAIIIHSYLDEHNVDLPKEHKGKGSASNIRYVLERLVKDGFAEVTMNSRGTYLTFRFKDDVNLTGHMPRFREAAVPAPAIPVVQEASPSPETIPVRKPAPPKPVIDIDDLLPPPPKAERYRSDEIDKVLDKWADNDPESYANWAERMIERLEALYG